MGRQARPIQQRTWALEGPGTPPCIRSWVLSLLRTPVPGRLCLPGTRTQKGHTPAKAHEPSMARGPTRGLSSERKEVLGPKAQGRRYHGVPSVLGTLCIRSWVLWLATAPRSWAWKGPGPGGDRQVTDYVPWAPGAHGTPHSGGRPGHAMCPGSTDCSPPAMLGRRALVPLGTDILTLFRLFRLFSAFRRIQAALPYPPDRFGRERAK